MTHTRCGIVAVIAGPDGVTIHVRDQGTDSRQVPAPGPAANGDGLAEGEEDPG